MGLQQVVPQCPGHAQGPHDPQAIVPDEAPACCQDALLHAQEEHGAEGEGVEEWGVET